MNQFLSRSFLPIFAYIAIMREHAMVLVIENKADKA